MASTDPAALPPFTGTLTPEHLSVICAERDRWLRVGLSTMRVDRPAAEAAVRRAYQAAGLPPPGVVVWMDSPLGGCLATATLRQLDDQAQRKPRIPLARRFLGKLRDDVGRHLTDQL